jgi:hypothetical protein
VALAVLDVVRTGLVAVAVLVAQAAQREVLLAWAVMVGLMAVAVVLAYKPPILLEAMARVVQSESFGLEQPVLSHQQIQEIYK